MSYVLLWCWASLSHAACEPQGFYDSLAGCRQAQREAQRFDNRAIAVSGLPVLVRYHCDSSADEAPVALGGAEARAGKKLAKRSSTFRAAITVREKPGRLQRLAILPGRREGCEKLRQPRSLRYVPDGRGRSVAADVPGNPVADRSAPGPTRASVKYGKRIDRQTTDEVRPDGSRAERFSAKAQSIGGFGRLSWPTGRFHLVEDARRGNHGLTTARDPGNVG